MVNTFIALLVELFPEKISKAEGEALAKKIREATLPGDYPSALKQIQKFRKTIASEL